MGIPVFSHVVVYERLKVFQRVGLISVALRVGMKRLATPRVLGFMLRGHAVPRLVECCRDTSPNLSADVLTTSLLTSNS